MSRVQKDSSLIRTMTNRANRGQSKRLHARAHTFLAWNLLTYCEGKMQLGSRPYRQPAVVVSNIFTTSSGTLAGADISFHCQPDLTDHRR